MFTPRSDPGAPQDSYLGTDLDGLGPNYCKQAIALIDAMMSGIAMLHLSPMDTGSLSPRLRDARVAKSWVCPVGVDMHATFSGGNSCWTTTLLSVRASVGASQPTCSICFETLREEISADAFLVLRHMNSSRQVMTRRYRLA
jgi:hypothetical protein